MRGKIQQLFPFRVKKHLHVDISLSLQQLLLRLKMYKNCKFQTTTTCFTHHILFCILLAFPIERLYYALLAASNANFHDAFIIPVILFTIFYHSPQESFVIKNEYEVFVVFCGITTRSEKKTHFQFHWHN